MSANAPWLRLSSETFDSGWLAALPYNVRLIWAEVLCHTKKQGRAGSVRVPLLQRWCAYRDIPIEPVQQLLDAAVKAKAMTIDEEGTWTMLNWKSYQMTDETVNERVTRHRENQRRNTQGNAGTRGETEETDGNGVVTECNALQDDETEGNGVNPSCATFYNLQFTKDNINTPPQTPKGEVVASLEKSEAPDSRATDAVVARIAAAFLSITGRKFQTLPTAAIWKNLRARVNAVRISERTAFEAQCIEVIQLKTSQWKGHPTMEKHLNPETLFRPSNFEKYLVEVSEQASSPGPSTPAAEAEPEEPVNGRDYVLRAEGKQVLKLVPGTDQPFDEQAWRASRRAG